MPDHRRGSEVTSGEIGVGAHGVDVAAVVTGDGDDHRLCCALRLRASDERDVDTGPGECGDDEVAKRVAADLSHDTRIDAQLRQGHRDIGCATAGLHEEVFRDQKFAGRGQSSQWRDEEVTDEDACAEHARVHERPARSRTARAVERLVTRTLTMPAAKRTKDCVALVPLAADGDNAVDPLEVRSLDCHDTVADAVDDNLAVRVEEGTEDVAHCSAVAKPAHLGHREAAHSHHGAVISSVTDSDQRDARRSCAIEPITYRVVLHEGVAHVRRLRVGGRVAASLRCRETPRRGGGRSHSD